MTRRKTAPWGNRIVGTGTLPASQFLANAANWRIHPKPQQDVMSGMLNAVGFVQHVIVNRRSDKAWGRDRNVETLIDGHLRVELALTRGEETDVPVVFVDLDPDEERSVLATFDPIGAMAATDRAKLDELVAAMPEDLRALTAVLREDRKGLKKIVSFETTESDSRYVVLVECRSEHEQVGLLDRLIAEGFTCKAMLS